MLAPSASRIRRCHGCGRQKHTTRLVRIPYSRCQREKGERSSSPSSILTIALASSSTQSIWISTSGNGGRDLDSIEFMETIGQCLDVEFEPDPYDLALRFLNLYNLWGSRSCWAYASRPLSIFHQVRSFGILALFLRIPAPTVYWPP